MPLKNVHVRLVKSDGGQAWRMVDVCPYCGVHHELDAGDASKNPTAYLGGRTLPCGSMVNLKSGNLTMKDMKHTKREFSIRQPEVRSQKIEFTVDEMECIATAIKKSRMFCACNGWTEPCGQCSMADQIRKKIKNQKQKMMG
jgi:hypothetical protein